MCEDTSRERKKVKDWLLMCVHMKLHIVNSTKDRNNTESNAQPPCKQCFIWCHKNLAGNEFCSFLLMHMYYMNQSSPLQAKRGMQ